MQYSSVSARKTDFSHRTNTEHIQLKSKNLLQFVGSERTITADLKDSVAEEVVWKGPPAEQAGYRSFYFTDGIGIQAPTRLRRGDEYFFRAWWIYKGNEVEVYENVARLMNGKLISLKSGVYTQASEAEEIAGETGNKITRGTGMVGAVGKISVFRPQGPQFDPGSAEI